MTEKKQYTPGIDGPSERGESRFLRQLKSLAPPPEDAAVNAFRRALKTTLFAAEDIGGGPKKLKLPPQNRKP